MVSSYYPCIHQPNNMTFQTGSQSFEYYIDTKTMMHHHTNGFPGEKKTSLHDYM